MSAHMSDSIAVASQDRRPSRDKSPRGRRRASGRPPFLAVVVRHPDVEEQVDVMRGVVDVGHHRIDRGIRVRHEVGLVAPDGLEAADGPADLEEREMTLGDLGLHRRRVKARRAGDIGKAGQYAFLGSARWRPILVSPKSR